MCILLTKFNIFLAIIRPVRKTRFYKPAIFYYANIIKYLNFISKEIFIEVTLDIHLEYQRLMNCLQYL